MIEILIALAVIAIALLGLLSAFTYGMRANASASYRTQALNHARVLLGEIRRNAGDWGLDNETDPIEAGLDDADDSARTAMNAAPFDDAGMIPVMPDSEKMTRNIQITKDLGGGQPGRDQICKVQVRVFWTERDNNNEKMVELIGYVPYLQTGPVVSLLAP